MAETVVNAGAIRSPLEYYNELANQSSPSLAFPQVDSDPCVQIYQVCSSSVRKTMGAVAVARDGARSKDQETAHVLALLSAPADSDSPAPALLTHVARLLEPVANRKVLMESANPAAAWASLMRMESELRPASRAVSP